MVRIPDEEHSETEVRWIALGKDASGEYALVIHTFEWLADERGRVRLISAGRPKRAELRDYGETQQGSEGGSEVHIARLKEEKKPRSANEMAALVGYYRSSLAPLADRKSTINRKDIETYFKIAKFPLPNQIPMTLANAKSAGYFDAVGSGAYKLNAVGHSLVVHSMPRGSSTEPVAKSKRKHPATRAPRTKRKQA